MMTLTMIMVLSLRKADRFKNTLKVEQLGYIDILDVDFFFKKRRNQKVICKCLFLSFLI